MKLTIQRDDLLSALQSVQGVVAQKNTLPILSSVLFRAEQQSIFLAASNLEVTITAKAEANVSRQGAVCIPAKRLIDIVSAVSSAELEIETDDKNVTSILAGESKFRVKGLSASEYIDLPKVSESKCLMVGQQKLKSMLGQVSFAMCQEIDRQNLCGAFFKAEEGELRIVATNGKQLALAEIDDEIAVHSVAEFILPSDAAKQVLRLSSGGEVTISASKNNASFDFGNVGLTAKLIEGQYPNYKQVIPSDHKGSITVNRDRFRDSIRRAAIMTTDRNLAVRLVLSENRAEIISNSPDSGDASESFAVKYGGPKFQSAYDPKYLLDCLSAYQQDEVLFEFNDELSPAVFRVPGALCVVMPMRLN